MSDASPPQASIDPHALMRIEHLHLRARTIVEGFFGGLHRSPFHGQSVEFSEYRPYSVGDDLRSLDWKLLARSDRLYVKKFEDETTRRCYLVLDQSKSMGYGSLEYSKLEYARTLSATLAYFLTRTRDNVGLLTFDDMARDFVPAIQRPGHLRRLLVALSRQPSGEGTDLDTPLSQIAAIVPRRGLVVLISDLLTPVGTLKSHLASLRSRGHEVLMIRVLDPSEKELSLPKATMVTDVESGRQIYLDPEQAREKYRAKFLAHQLKLQRTCDAVGVALHTVSTDQPLTDVLFEFVRVSNARQTSIARGGMLASQVAKEVPDSQTVTGNRS
ncbi:VWA domain containing CoxE-like protein [Rubripirellula amarantea]|uniref:VWA domain containing CoxE-like protein n=1 Tax=Rubripirellula amarantea TaxID=2527999 RepID=A0A5C5WB99_9BACT|nr:DUF58 domain-containing protein [Rubripirellula amarantea]TWT48186.1 VWA domain containing CoxE-like protein [Rubripirellula amarantea]